MGMAVADTQFHVLAVDDSPVDRKFIESLLKHSSFQVTTVDSGSKALEFLGFREEDELQSLPNEPSVSPNSENHPEQQVSDSPRKKDAEVNLVITDYCMPGMTGYDLLKKIKESSLLRNIPVVIMSSENVPSRINRCLEEGAEEFFLKPVKLADVNKLKPHMLRAKNGDESKQVKPQQIDDLQHEPELKAVPQIIQQQPQLPQQPQQQQENNNKRKSIESSSANHIGIEEGHTPDRTRPRYSGLAVL